MKFRPKSLTSRRSRRSVLCLMLSAAVAGAHADEPQPLAETAPLQSAFDKPLDCMDSLFRTYGYRGEPVLIEDINDATKKVNASARAMFIDASNRMSATSGAISLTSFDSSSMIERIRVEPRTQNWDYYKIGGSISGYDENLEREQKEYGVSIFGFDLGSASSMSESELSVDLHVTLTSDLSVIQGASSSNVAKIRRFGKGRDGGLIFEKFGAKYSFNVSRTGGTASSLRALIQLGAIELYGKLFKVPFWQCTGADPSQSGIRDLTTQWFIQLYDPADPRPFVLWLQRQMRARGLYGGALDGIATPELEQAAQAYGTLLDNPQDYGTYFQRYLRADHDALAPKVASIRVAPPPVAAPDPVAKPPATAGSTFRPDPDTPANPLQIASAQASYAPGNLMSFSVAVNSDGHVYCVLFGDHGARPVFPNLSAGGAYMRAGDQRMFPAPNAPFVLRATRSATPEALACYWAPRDFRDEMNRSVAAHRDMQALTSDLMQRMGGELQGNFIQIPIQ